MKQLLKAMNLKVPEGVTLTVKARKVTVKGPMGTVVRSFTHMPIDFTMVSKDELRIERWFTSGKANASIKTCYSHIMNAIIGVTKVPRAPACASPHPAALRAPRPAAPRPRRPCRAASVPAPADRARALAPQGFLYKMRFVYAHFPINVAITNNAKKVEIRNFLGEKVVRVVDALGDVKVKRSTDVKDEITLEGIDIDDVSRTAALINGICKVRNKDIRKFLDGIYVSHKGNMIVD